MSTFGFGSRHPRPSWGKAVALVLSGVLPGSLLPRPVAQAASAAPAHPFAALRAAYTLLLKDYAGHVTPGALMRGALRGMLAAAGDPFTTYLPPAQAMALSQSLNGFDGIGVVIAPVSQGAVIQSVFLGSPAQKAGLRSGDLIESVAGHSVAGRSTATVASWVRGPVGSPVTLKVQVPGKAQPETLTLRRIAIVQPTVFGSSPAPGIGLIRITRFGVGTVSGFDAAYQKLRQQPGGLRGLVLDLRNNPGGYVNAALRIADQLAPAGPLLKVVAAHGQVTTYTAPAHAAAPPVVILVNGMTASAAEILAGTLQYRGAAELVGSRTYGKGSIQEMFTLPGGQRVKITVAMDELPNGRSWEHVGLNPNVVARPAPSPLANLPRFAPAGTTSVRRGQIGLDVLGLQQRLQLLGYYRGHPDGVFGRMTAAGVQLFQEHAHLTPTGVATPATWRDLEGAVAARIHQLQTAPRPDAVLQKGLQVLRARLATARTG